MSAHALLSASSSHRWLNCPGSINMEKGIDDTPSTAAAYGTKAHALAELCLSCELNAIPLINKPLTIDDLMFTIDSDMVEGVQVYLDYVRNLKGKLLIERRVDFSSYVPGGFGTADAVVIHEGDDEGIISVVDLKFGTGVRVDAKHNSQLMLYALGVLNEYGGDLFKLVICQPRLDHISEWEINKRDLLDWAESVVKPKAKLALSDSPPLTPSETACRFCKAKGLCRPFAHYELNAIYQDFETIDNPGEIKNINQLENAEIATLLSQLKLFKQWVEALELRAITELTQGNTIPGYKLVEGRRHRIWTDEPLSAQALRNAGLKTQDIYPKIIISPASAEKHLGRKHPIFQTYISKPKGKPTLAPLSDKREAITQSVKDDFENVS